MASSNPCSVCPKYAGTCYCPGCKAYFCNRDFRNHREMLVLKLDELTVNRNELHEKIKKTNSQKYSGDPLLWQIDAWQEDTIQKVKQAAQHVREQVLQILNSQQEEIKRQFQALSQEMEQLRESENVLEHDLSKLKNQIEQLDKSLENLSQSPEIKLNMKQSEQITWNRIIYAEDISTSFAEEQHWTQLQAEESPPPTPIAKPPTPIAKKLECRGHVCVKCSIHSHFRQYRSYESHNLSIST